MRRRAGLALIRWGLATICFALSGPGVPSLGSPRRCTFVIQCMLVSPSDRTSEAARIFPSVRTAPDHRSRTVPRPSRSTAFRGGSRGASRRQAVLAERAAALSTESPPNSTVLNGGLAKVAHRRNRHASAVSPWGVATRSAAINSAGGFSSRPVRTVRRLDARSARAGDRHQIQPLCRGPSISSLAGKP